MFCFSSHFFHGLSSPKNASVHQRSPFIELLSTLSTSLKPTGSTERTGGALRSPHTQKSVSNVLVSAWKGFSPLDRAQVGSLLQSGLSFAQGTSLHSCIIQNGFDSDIFLMNHLMNLYGKCGALEEASWVFGEMDTPNLVSWNVLLSIYAQHEYRAEAFQIYTQLQEEGFHPNRITFLSVLRVCDSLAKGKSIHLCIITNGREGDPILGGALITMYHRCDAVQEAELVFERSNARDVSTWNSLLSAFVQLDLKPKALKFFWLMLEKRLEPDPITFNSVLHACAGMETLDEGMSIHSSIIESGLDSDSMVGTALTNMYGKSGALLEARTTFDDMHNHDVVSWTAMISSYVQHECCVDALACFDEMQFDGIKPNDFTFASVLNACGTLKALEEGEIIHSYVVELGHEGNCVVGTGLISMYSSCGVLGHARLVFDGMPKRNLVTWATMIDAYNEKNQSREALDLFWVLNEGQERLDEFVCMAALKACISMAALAEGERVHELVRSNGFESNHFVQTALVKLYGECRVVDQAESIFNKSHPRDLVAWNVMLAVYAEKGLYDDLLLLFERMARAGVQPNATSFLSVLMACAGLSTLLDGMHTHTYIVECGSESEVLVGNAAINLYGRCGLLDDACLMFDKMQHRTVMTWTSLMAAYSQQGHVNIVVRVFHSMLQHGVKPDDIAFVTMLSACSHGGLIEECLLFFGLMGEFFITPTPDHCRCIVDLFGRAGLLEPGHVFITRMPLQPEPLSLISFLSACKNHGDVSRGSWVADQVTGMALNYSAPYILLTSIYTADENWEAEEDV